MGSSEISAGKAFLKLLVDDKEFAKGLSAAESKLQNFSRTALRLGAQIGAVGAAITAPFALSIKAFTDTGSALNDMSERTGLSVEKLSALSFAAEQSGTSLEAVEKALRFMAKNGKDVNTFDQVAKSIAAIADPSKRAQAAIENFGKQGTQLLPMIAQLDSLTNKAKELGLVIDTETSKRADNLGDAFDTLKTQAKVLSVQIGAALQPAVQKLADTITNALPAVIEFVKQHTELVAVIPGLGLSLISVSTAITALGGSANLATKAVKGLLLVLNLLGKNPWVLIIVAGLAAANIALRQFVSEQDAAVIANYKTADSSRAHAKATDEETEALKKGNKELEKRNALLARLSPLDRELFTAATEREAANARAIEQIDAEIKATDELIRRLKDRGDIESKALRDAQQRRESLQGQRNLISGDKAKLDAERQKKFDEEVAKNREKLAKQREEQEEARRKHRESLQRTFDSVLNQFESFSRPVASTFNGRLAPQILGTSAAQSTETRRLRLEEQQAGFLKEIRDALKKSGVLLIGAS